MTAFIRSGVFLFRGGLSLFKSRGWRWRRNGSCYLLGGFFLAGALHFARPAVSSLEQPLQVRGFHLVREFLFSLGFLLVVLLLSEPFLAQESQKVGFTFRLHAAHGGRHGPRRNCRH